jgi:hypothetical protein
VVVKIILQKENRAIILRAGHRAQITEGRREFKEGHNLIYSKNGFRVVKQRK